MTVARDLPVMTAAQWQAANATLECDVVIVGSGAGGAVMAFELANAGKSVIVLEAGAYVPSERFTENFPDMLATLYQDHGNQTNKDGDLMVLQGSCVGGSTVVNGCVAFRVPDFILKDWHRDHGLTNLTSEVLAPYFDKVEKRLSVHDNEPHEINSNSAKMREGANKLGWSVKPLRRNIKECALTGHCLSGCKTDRKQSMLVTYLPWAAQKGAKIYADTWVEKISVEQGRATGVTARVKHPVTGASVATLNVSAKRVVVAAGAVQTPLLFLRSGIANSSGQIGRNFACHPSCMVVAEFEETIQTWRGAMLGVYVDEFEHPDKGGFVLEGGGAGPVELGVSTEPGTGRVYMEYMAKAGNYASAITLIHDHNVGQVKLEDGKKVIDYQLSDADFDAMKASIRAAAKLYLAAGAKRIYLPTVAKLSVASEAEIEPALATLKNEPFSFRMVSYHPQGTMRMGADPQKSVVNPKGETHDVKGLYVADASLFPTSILVNPQITVYGMSNYIADQLLADLGA
jgi:choline dehydrogenase-like flavoprotein